MTNNETLSEQILRIYCEAIEADIMRCGCGGWVYIGKPCGFCEKWSNRG